MKCRILFRTLPWQRSTIVVQGERGPKGDTGDVVTKTGKAGPPGPPGRTGRSGRALSRWQSLAGFAFIVFAFLLLGWRVQVNTDAIKATAYDTCLDQASGREKLNASARGFIAIEQNNIFVSPEITAARIKLYNEAILPVQPCKKQR